MKSKIKTSFALFLLTLFSTYTNVFPQFHDYTLKYGFQGHFLVPRTEFDNDSYNLSLMVKGLIKTEISSILEAEVGFGIGQLKGRDLFNENWSTDLFPLDFDFIVSPFYYKSFNPFIYSGITLLRWKVSTLPKVASSVSSDELGWDLSIPLGTGLELMLSEEILLDIRGGYNFVLSDDINYYNESEANDGYFNFGFGLTFVIGGGFTDRDKDGLTKNQEIKIGTDPFNRDTDGDKLSDGDEIKLYNTDPLNSDSDSDSLNDYEEIIEYDSDPNSSDTDGDNISDYMEIMKYKTNLLLKDSDSDGISDNYELHTYYTDPLNSDTDNDNLTDSEELKIYNTNPNKSDSDGDGINDGDEILRDKTDPLDPASYKNYEIDDKVLYLTNDPVILEGVYFETNSTNILSGSKVALNKLLSTLQSSPELKIEIRGYTDNTGNYKYNKELSLKRAEEIKKWLVIKGIDALRINTIGYGEMNPIAENDTPEGRVKNRRIEIFKVIR